MGILLTPYFINRSMRIFASCIDMENRGINSVCFQPDRLNHYNNPRFIRVIQVIKFVSSDASMSTEFGKCLRTAPQSKAILPCYSTLNYCYLNRI